MLLPTQAAAGLAATNMMQSTLDSIEERRKEQEEKASGKKADPVVQARISASTEAKRAQEKIATALFDSGKVNVNELKMQLVDRLGGKLGLERQDGDSNFSYGKALEEIVKNLDPSAARKLEKELGLQDLGISLVDMVAAIKNPYGNEDDRLEAALEKRENGGRMTPTETAKVVQRLEDAADPKTLEELKLGPQGYDPTRVVDAETKAELQEDIRAAEAGQKLEDVQDMQDAVGEKNDRAVKGETAGDPGAAAAEDAMMLAVLAAASGEAPDNIRTDAPAPAEGSTDTGGGAADPDDGDSTQGNLPLLGEDANGMQAAQVAEKKTLSQQILTVHVDEIGVYELLRRRLAA